MRVKVLFCNYRPVQDMLHQAWSHLQGLWYLKVVITPILVLLLILTILYVWLNVSLYLKRRRYHAMVRPPIKPGLLWFLGHALTIGPRVNAQSSFVVLMSEVSAEVNSEIFVLFFLHMNFVAVLDIETPPKILTNHRVFLKQGGKKDNIGYINGNRVFGERGMVTEMGTELWYHKRRTMDAAFHKTALKSLINEMNDITLKLSLYMTQVKEKDRISFDIYEVFTRVALETICRCGFNLNDDLIFSEDTLLVNAFHHIFYSAQLQFQHNLKFMMPWSFRKEKDKLR